MYFCVYRYRCESLCRHWSSNKQGFCLLSPACSEVVEDLPHILRFCHGLHQTREKLVDFTIKYAKTVPAIADLILNLSTPSNPDFCQFLLDCSCLEPVIHAVQTHGQDVLHHLFRITRTWVYTLHKARMKSLGRWNILWNILTLACPQPEWERRRSQYFSWVTTDQLQQAQLGFTGPYQKLPRLCGCWTRSISY